MPLHPLRIGFAVIATLIAATVAFQADDPLVRALAVVVLGGVTLALLLTGQRLGAARTEPADDVIISEGAQGSAALPWQEGLLDAVEHPVLILEDSLVAAANGAARHLLGDFIRGADMRTALRHPDIVDRLSRTPPGETEMFDVVGIARSASQWRVTIVPLDERRRVVQLIDQSDATRLDRMRADFVANASHELRTPLASIRGFVETLEDDAAGADPVMRARFLGIIGREAARMQQLVDDLLSMSRVESVKAMPPTALVDVGQVLSDVVHELRGGGDPRGADIVPLSPDEGMTLVGDAVQLKQAVHNIVGNAMKYGRPATPIHVSADARGAMLAIVVRDEGDGVAQEHLPRLTERFYRVDAARSRSVGGTGLGLSIVRHIVERHRGRMDIASKPGVGTTVTLFLPRAHPRA